MFLHYSYMGRRKETNQNLYTVMDSPITWNDDYGKTMKNLCAQSFEIKDTRFRKKKKKIPHVFLYKAAHGLAMAPWRHTWQTWTPNPTVPEKDGQVTQCHKKNTSLGQPPPKKLQHLIQSPSIFAKDLSLGIAIHLVLLSSSTATSVLVLKPQSMHLKTLGSSSMSRLLGASLIWDWRPAYKRWNPSGTPKKMSYILVVKSNLHPGVFIMAFDIFQGTPILYTSWFYDRIFHGQFQNPHKPWGSVTESDS